MGGFPWQTRPACFPLVYETHLSLAPSLGPWALVFGSVVESFQNCFCPLPLLWEEHSSMMVPLLGSYWKGQVSLSSHRLPKCRFFLERKEGDGTYCARNIIPLSSQCREGSLQVRVRLRKGLFGAGGRGGGDQGGPRALLIAWPKVCPGSCARSFWKVWFSVSN